MELGLTVELGLLLDTYGNLLTDKMRNILSMYVEENMSLQEIADYLKISKPAVLDAIQTSQKKLLQYEQKVKMLKLKKQIKTLLDCDACVLKQELQKIVEEAYSGAV